MQDITKGAVIGIIGIAIGSILTGFMNEHAQREKLQMQFVIDSFKFDTGNYPVEVTQLKQFVDEVRNLSFMSSKTITRLAEIHRKHPNCSNIISDKCRPVYVETILVMRSELGSGDVAGEDIDLILSGKFLAAKRAFHRLQKK